MGNSIPGYDGAQPIQFTNLDSLLWGIVKTLQYFSLPVMALSIAALGIALIASGDDTDRKSRLKGWIFNIFLTYPLRNSQKSRHCSDGPNRSLAVKNAY